MSIYIYNLVINIIIINYNLLINIRDINKRTNLGNIYFDNTYNIITRNTKAKITWFIK